MKKLSALFIHIGFILLIFGAATIGIEGYVLADTVQEFESAARKQPDVNEGWLGPDTRRILQVFNVFFSIALLSFAGVSLYLRKKLKEKVARLEKTQQQIEKQNEYFRLVTENTTEGIWVFNVDTGTGVFSQQWYVMFGYEPVDRELSLSEMDEYTHPDDVSAVRSAFASYIENGGQGQFTAEMRLRRGDGQWRWLQALGRTVKWDDNGKPLRIIGLHLDIQKSKESQQKLRQSEENFVKLFKYSPIPMAILSEDEKVIDVNRRLTAVLGYTLADVDNVENWWRKAFPDVAYRDEVRVTWHNAIETAKNSDSLVAPHEYSVSAKDGTEHIVIIEGTIIDSNILVSFYDITARRRAEEDREKLSEQLHQSQKLEAVGVLAGGVAHDFNNMIGGIMGFSELLLDRLETDNPHRGYIERILDAASRSADLTRQLLAFARKQTVAPVTLDLNQAVESMLKLLRRLIGENIDLSWLPGKKTGILKIDPSQLDQLLANLCVNARDAIADVGKITIETDIVAFDQSYCDMHAGFKPGNYALLSVSDSGEGMNEETITHIFEPFFTTKGTGQGTGMGLATVYGVVQQNNGFINVYSEPGQGTTFRIYFPNHDEAVVTKRGAPEHIPKGKGEIILLVEDDSTLLEMAQTMLENIGYNVLSAKTPGEAIRTTESYQGQIELCISDVIMPEMNGRELADLLHGISPDSRFLFMSGYTANVIARQGVLDEGIHFIQKPFSQKELANKVRRMLE